MAENRWHEIWKGKGKGFDIAQWRGLEEFAAYSELKKLDGFDVAVGNENAYYRCFYDSAVNMWEEMISDLGITSAYEVGYGSGANLYLLKNRGIDVGGIDYSDSLADIAGMVLGKEINIEVGGAIDMPVDRKYDVVFSDSVFTYFPDEAYGMSVLEKMYDKARRAVFVMEVFDKSRQAECEAYRKSMVDDYDEKYQGLDKVFYDKERFVSFARKRNCRLEFGDVKNEQYWNSRYLYNCFIYKE